MRVKTYRSIMLVAVILLCLLSLGLPLFYNHWSNIQLARQGTLRPEQPGMLSAEGQENPLVYALYRNRFVTQSALELPGDVQRIQQDLLSRTEALAQAGVLPDFVAQRAQWILEQPVSQATSKAENGFASATYLIPQKGASGYCSVYACWQEDTEMVVSYIVTADTVLNDLEPYLSAYQAYLQVNNLPDWQVDFRQEGEAWGWSQTGQLSLFCRRKAGRFLLGAVSQAEPLANEFAS